MRRNLKLRLASLCLLLTTAGVVAQAQTKTPDREAAPSSKTTVNATTNVTTDAPQTNSPQASAAKTNDAGKTNDAAKTTEAAKSNAVAASNITITPATSPVDLARAALAALGGEKFRHVKSIVLIGTVDLYAPNSAQSLPGKFVMVMAEGSKYRVEVESPVVKFRQIFDGEQSYSSIAAIQTPNPSKFGLTLLTKYDQPGYNVTALPDKKKQRAFRITDPEGNSTDFFIDPVTARVMLYTVPYQGNIFGVEFKSQKEVEGILVPVSFTQRFETPQGAFFAEYKVKDAHVNQPLGADVFAIPAQ